MFVLTGAPNAPTVKDFVLSRNRCFVLSSCASGIFVTGEEGEEGELGEMGEEGELGEIGEEGEEGQEREEREEGETGTSWPMPRKRLSSNMGSAMVWLVFVSLMAWLTFVSLMAVLGCCGGTCSTRAESLAFHSPLCSTASSL